MHTDKSMLKAAILAATAAYVVAVARAAAQKGSVLNLDLDIAESKFVRAIDDALDDAFPNGPWNFG